MANYTYYGENGIIVDSEYNCCAKKRENDDVGKTKFYVKFQDGLILNPYKRVSINNRQYKMIEVTKDQFDRYVNFLVEKREYQLIRLGREIQ